jgi:hypothetical protein
VRKGERMSEERRANEGGNGANGVIERKGKQFFFLQTIRSTLIGAITICGFAMGNFQNNA